MTVTTSIPELQSLPTPKVVDAKTFQQIYVEYVRLFLTLNPDYGALLESDPVIKLIQAASYREYILRQRLNDAALSNILAFSTQSDLDHLASFYGVTRLTGETDTQLQERIQLRVEAWSTAGGKAQYEYWARTTSSDVLDAHLDNPIGGKIDIYILAKTGVPDQALLDAITANVTADNIQVFTDTVEVHPAVVKEVDITVSVELLPGTPESVYTKLKDDFPTTFQTTAGRVGRDLTISWIASQFQVDGVHDVVVTLPTNTVEVNPNEFVKLGTFTSSLVPN